MSSVYVGLPRFRFRFRREDGSCSRSGVLRCVSEVWCTACLEQKCTPRLHLCRDTVDPVYGSQVCACVCVCVCVRARALVRVN